MQPALLALTLMGPPVDVAWHGDATCPSDQFFNNDLATHLRAGAATTRVHARVTVARTGDEWALELTLTTLDGASTRRLTGSSCPAVSAAAAFITALVVDPGLLTREPAPAPTPEPAPEPAPAPEQQPAPTPAPEQQPAPTPPPPAPAPAPAPARPAVRGFVRLAGGLEALGMPRVGPQVSPAIGVFGRRWRLELLGLYRAPTRAPAAAVPGVAGVLRLWTLGVRGCGVVRPGPLELPLCLGLEAGRAIGDAEGPLARSERARLPWLAVVVAPALAWSPRPWLAVWVGLDVAVPLIPGKFTITGVGDLHKYAPISLRAGLGLEFRFPPRDPTDPPTRGKSPRRP